MNNRLKLILGAALFSIAAGAFALNLPAPVVGKLNFSFQTASGSQDVPSYSSVSFTGLPSSMYRVDGAPPSGTVPAGYTTNLVFWGTDPNWNSTLQLKVTPKVGNHTFSAIDANIYVQAGTIYPFYQYVYSQDGEAICDYGVQAGAPSVPALFTISCKD